MAFINNFVDWAHQCLLDNTEAQEYLMGRGVSPDQWSHHSIGFVSGDFIADFSCDNKHNESCSDRDKRQLWCDSCRYNMWSSTWEKTDEEDSKKTQTIGRKIVGSIVLPLTSYSGSMVGFQVRSIYEKVYDSFMTTCRPEGYFFGVGPNITSIWSSGEVILVEGPFDQLIMERLVTPNVISLLTNSANQVQVRFLRRFVKRINLCLDLDAAGRKGAKEFRSKHGDHFHIINDIQYKYPGFEAKDAGDIWKRVGDVKFSKHMQKFFV